MKPSFFVPEWGTFTAQFDFFGSAGIRGHRRKLPPYQRLTKWARQGSNLRPTDYESAALTN